jgi:type I restriction-modification system DNA methylase subunit
MPARADLCSAGIDVELRPFRAFAAVARERSFTRAAASLLITQPALNRTIQQLEAALQVQVLAAGAGGFLLSAYEHMKSARFDHDQRHFLRDQALRGWEIVDATARQCAMNLLLHRTGRPGGESLVTGHSSASPSLSGSHDLAEAFLARSST